ncbi:hypothetical protein OEB94_00860 [Streptomyces sp. ICN988]|uniref:hypothetical protein n=1 Tax=Streptomyces sp. ICN988 TaxID=2983765 RepID=UPI0021E4161E|nr:hypothetical protein [Streptomyces sp. ICN988]MCV2457851.1 hypothetical protein [Streptomyces sp. ICN988]
MRELADHLVASRHQRHDDMAVLILRYDGMRVRPIRAGWAVWRLDIVLAPREEGGVPPDSRRDAGADGRQV